MKTLLSSAIMAAGLVLNLPAATTLSVSGSANIFGAGHASPPAPGGGSGGLAPSFTGFSARPDRVLTFSSVSGSISLTSGLGGLNGPDGNQSLASDISSFGGISGIQSDASGFLAGVFLGPTEPADPAPFVLDFTSSGSGTSFLTLTPQIGQVFFIGDGLTGTGSGAVQQFFVPPSATRFYLGFADAFGYAGLPGQYQDNVGLLNATFQIVPEPGTWALFGLGFIFICATRQAKRRSGSRRAVASSLRSTISS